MPVSLVGGLVNRSRTALALLAGTAAASALIYWLAFAQAYNLFGLRHEPLYDLTRRATVDPFAYARLILAFAVLGLLYGLGWAIARHVRGTAAWAIVAAGAVASSAILLCMYPIGAADLFADVMYGRILTRYGGNPYFDLGAHFPGDPFFPYMAWRSTSAHYGPLCIELFGVAARLAGDGIVANVIAFKLLNALFLAGSIAVVAATLHEAAPEWALAGTLALAWNPLVLYETMGNGHNDILMAFWVLTAIWYTVAQRHTLAVLALVSGALVKIVPALLIPALGLVALRAQASGRARLRFAFGSAAAALGLAAAVYAPLWRGPASLTFLQRKAMFTTSLPAALWGRLAPLWGSERAGDILGAAAWVAVGLFALVRAYRTLRDPSWLAFPRAAFDILLFYLLVACPWYKEWYSIWPLAVAATIPSASALSLAVLFNYTSLAQPLVFWPLWFGRELAPDTVRELRLGPAVMALPWAALAGQWAKRLIRRRAGARSES